MQYFSKTSTQIQLVTRSHPQPKRNQSMTQIQPQKYSDFRLAQSLKPKSTKPLPKLDVKTQNNSFELGKVENHSAAKTHQIIANRRLRRRIATVELPTTLGPKWVNK